MRKLLFLLLFSLGSSYAQDVRTPLYGRAADATRTFTQDEILREFGPMRRNGNGFGGRITRALPKTGKYVRYGGVYMLPAIVVNEALNWFYNEARKSLSPALDQWYESTGPWVISQDSRRVVIYKGSLPAENEQVASNPNWCATAFPQGTGSPNSFWEYWLGGSFVFRGPSGEVYSSGGVRDGYRSGYGFQRQYPPSPGEAASDMTDWAAKTLPKCGGVSNDAPLSDVFNRDPAASNALKDIVAQYITANPRVIPPLLDPVPNVNEENDDVTDPGLDTDKDGSTDGDELRRGPGVLTTPGNRPHPDDGAVTDPSDPESKPLDTDGDSIPDWRDSDDDNDGLPDDEETPDGQKDPSKKPASSTDTDGDGVTDDMDPDDDNDGASDEEEEKAGTDPKNPDSKPEETPEETPDDEAACKDASGTWENDQCTMPKPEETPDSPELPGIDKDVFKLPNFDNLKKNFDLEVDKVKKAASEKFPFGIGTKWFGQLTVGQGECADIPLDLQQIKLTFTPCKSPVMQWGHSTLRPLFLILIWALAGLSAARIASNS